MAEMITKTYRAETKAGDSPGEIHAIVSTTGQDRDGESIKAEAFTESLPTFLKHPILLSSHDYRDLRKQIGEVLNLASEKGGIKATLKYYVGEGNEEADWAYKLAAKGIAAYSVGFIPQEWEDGDGEKKPRRIHTKGELLEISQVLVPSNRSALSSLRAKGISPLVQEMAERAMEIVTKPEETENYIRIPAPGEEGKHEGHRIRTIDLNEREGIKALYCGEDKVVITYLFAKDKEWTMERSKEWVREHHKKALEGIEIKMGATLSHKTKEKLMESIGFMDKAKGSLQECMGEAEPKKESYDPKQIGQAVAEAVAAALGLKKEVSNG